MYVYDLTDSRNSAVYSNCVETCARFCFHFTRKCIIYLMMGKVRNAMRKGGCDMSSKDSIIALEEENRRLKADNEKLLEVIAQMNLTLDRLIRRYITNG